ncbi:ATP-binding cassette domain-containing protein [Vicingaceae bacterium]|jgi:phospholipid/cholesterol/gamma-HCH transport system ATP-binding protein|nr:ATP-binding cassette domain-containing protein [Vicingaceae bacterium]
MIKLENISKAFNGEQILSDIGITYEQGKTNLIIGASGSGKSVLTKCTVGLIQPDTGKVFYDDREFTALDSKSRQEIRTEIGMLFQGNALFDSLTIEQNVMFPLQMHTDMKSDEILERVNFCLERVQLTGVNHKYPAEISGGMQKRVALARAISMKPKYLFCDEPNSGLDPQTSIVIDQLISEITKEYNMTTIIVTHDMNSVMEIGDKVIFIHKGRKWWEGNSDSILSTTNKELSDFVFASSVMKRLVDKK